MPRMLDGCGSLAVCDEPGQAMRAVAEKLAARGVGVRLPEWQECRRLTITSVERARCELTVEDGGPVRWYYRPRSGGGTDPAEMTGLVLRVLGAAGRTSTRAPSHDGCARPAQGGTGTGPLRGTTALAAHLVSSRPLRSASCLPFSQAHLTVRLT